MVGTFDVENYGDLLFPLLARHELTSRIPELELDLFSYHSRDTGSWPYDVRPLAELGDRLGDIDLVLVGGGHLIRFDKTVAFGYVPPVPELHHPTAYGLMPTLLAGWTGVPVAWNAVGVSRDTPRWAARLLAEASRAAQYLAVRDEPSADEIRRVAPDAEVRVVPDTAFGVAALLDCASPEVVELQEELGLVDRSYVVYQPSPDLAPFRSWLVRVLRWYADHGLTVVELPISPCLGDRVGIVDVTAATLSPSRWPSPLAVAGIVAGAEAVVGRSLHLSITALAAGVPVVRRTSEPGSKYRVLDGLRGVHIVADDVGPGDSLPLGRSGPAEDVAALAAALGRHWDSIAALVDDRPPARASALAASIGRLTELEESAERAEADRARLERALETATAELELERSRGSHVDRMIAVREGRVRELDHELREAGDRVQQMASSRSWRLTRPLRSLRSALGRSSAPRTTQAPSEPPGVAVGQADVSEQVPARDLEPTSSPARPSVDLRSPPDDLRASVDAYRHGRDGPATPVPLLEHVVDVPTSPVRKIAFYLPQFHPIPENDEWWGRGFTEWRNVTRAEPLFEGHVQPRRPGELGYYDLRVVETQRRQVELARLYGIDAFCFHFYWFGGRRLLERPLEQYVGDPELDLPFCLCWANESWTRRWDGREDEILIEQQHSEADDVAFIDYVTRYLDDPRYVRVDGRPLLVVYRPGVLPDAASTVARWRDRYRTERGGELCVAHTTAFDDDPPEAYGCDASIEFPPVRLGARNPPVPPRLSEEEISSLSDERPYVFDGRFFVEESRRYPTPDRMLFRGVCPDWDNTPRRGKEAYVLWHTSPVGFQTWLRNALVETEDRLPEEQRLVFINAWNEWGESCYLEPDERHGYAYLEAVRVASVRAAVRPRSVATSAGPRVAAIVHAGDSSGLGEVLERIESLDDPPDLVVTTTTADREAVEAELKTSRIAGELLIVDRPGDLLALLDVVGSGHATGYDVLLKLHTAVLDRPRATEALDDLLDSEVVRDVLRAFAQQPQLGLVGPVVDRVVLGDLGPPGGSVVELAYRLGVDDVDAARDTYFASGLYFVRPAALAPLQAIELDRDDPDVHPAVTRSVGLAVVAAGFRIEDTRTFRRVAEAAPAPEYTA